MSLLDQIGADMLPEDKENLDGLFHGEIASHVTHGCKRGHNGASGRSAANYNDWQLRCHIYDADESGVATG